MSYTQRDRRKVTELPIRKGARRVGYYIDSEKCEGLPLKRGGPSGVTTIGGANFASDWECPHTLAV